MCFTGFCEKFSQTLNTLPVSLLTLVTASLDRLGQMPGPLCPHAQQRTALRVHGGDAGNVAQSGRRPHAGRHVAPLRKVEAASPVAREHRSGEKEQSK